MHIKTIPENALTTTPDRKDAEQTVSKEREDERTAWRALAALKNCANQKRRKQKASRQKQPQQKNISSKESPFLKLKRQPTSEPVDSSTLLDDSDAEEHPQRPTEWLREIKKESDSNNITIQCSIQPPETITNTANQTGKRRTRKPDWFGNNVMGAIDSDTNSTATRDKAAIHIKEENTQNADATTPQD